ncbi:MAG: zinc ribbon domain-containing protein [Halodesulfurarchaeum sp.]
MSKITFRADDELIERVEALDASKSEVMREALRAYLEGHGPSETAVAEGDRSLDALLSDRIDELVAERMEARQRPARDVNIDIAVQPTGAATVESDEVEEAASQEGGADPTPTPRSMSTEQDCTQCGESLSTDHVYCPNCGEKAAQRSFCECGTELRTDWAYCPTCGRRTPSADVLGE